ncbi:alpha/beta fold hydrolase [Penaeicola halotolerans]|uniref:alpha/beta fold hydrolase n=1 Tax=Penaeicola halotolerans TaxID=2793196 RepID=UPI001CF895C9|nr:alpha/beta fold hydrolase [Penaeicola halotolerans]
MAIKKLPFSHNHYQILLPSNGTVKATLLILHGMKEHSGRYVEFASYLSNQGYAVLIYDHIGHGHSVNEPKELGFFKKKQAAEQLVSDAFHLAEILKTQYPNVANFILGHSMGSFITRNLLREESNSFHGAIIVGTGGKVFGMSIIKSLFQLLNVIAPTHRSKFINTFFDQINNTRFKNEQPLDGTNWLSLDKQNRINFIQDSLSGIDFSFNGFATLFNLVSKATQKNWASKINKRFPFLFISGEQDPIGNFGKGVIQTVNDHQQDGFSDITLKLYENMRHEILNESIRQSVYEDVADWLAQQVK